MLSGIGTCVMTITITIVLAIFIQQCLNVDVSPSTNAHLDTLADTETQGTEINKMYVTLGQLRSWGTSPIAKKVFLYKGDSTKLKIDAIVNAANERMLGGGGIDGAIHRAAGPELLDECKRVEQVRPNVRCPTGEVRLTKGYELPAKHVIHTVGPIGEKPHKLESCYVNCLNLAKANNIRSLAFCSISTGVYGYPIDSATEVALSTTKRWLEEGNNKDAVDGIIFTVFSDRDADVYRGLLTTHFGPENREVTSLDDSDDGESK